MKASPAARNDLLIIALLSCLIPAAAAAAPPQPPPTVRRPAEATGTVVVPDQFLRRWDPVTVFFARDVGPGKNGAEDHPERFVTVTPPHPGAFMWLDSKTLQFRPAEPWPPLARFEWVVDRSIVRVTTLMAAPTSTIPADDAVGLDRIETVTMSFTEPIEPDAL